MKNSIKLIRQVSLPPHRRLIFRSLLTLLLLANPLSGRFATEKECQKATKLLLEKRAVQGFFGDYASGLKQFDGPAFSGDEETPEKPSLQTKSKEFLDECKKGVGPDICKHYSRSRNEFYDGEPPSDTSFRDMSTRPVSCKIFQGDKEVTEQDAPAGGFERVEWMSKYQHEKYHQANCRKENAGNTDPADSPYYRKMRTPKGLAEEEFGAYGVTVRILEDFLKKSENCAKYAVSLTKPLKGSCGSPAESSIEVVPNSPMQNSENLQVLLVNGGYERIINDPEPFTMGPGSASYKNNVTGSCFECCSAEAISDTAYLFGGPNRSIIVGQTEVPLGCQKGPKCGSDAGDPHICTHDGKRFDFQGVGEFVLARTSDFEVQVRYKPISNIISVNAAVAVRLKGDRVALYAGDPHRLTVNGRDFKLSIGAIHILPGGAVLRRDERWFRVSADGYGIEADVVRNRIGTINVRVPPGSRSGGLLGDRNDDRKDDIRPKGGEVLTEPVGFAGLYRKFGNSWRVSAETSLFDYADGESTATFTFPEYPKRLTKVKDINPAVRAPAEKICRKAGITDQVNLENCIFDVSLTGDATFAIDAAGQSLSQDRLEVKSEMPEVVRKTTADGITIESPKEGLSSFEIDISFKGGTPQHILRFAKIGGRPASGVNNPGSAKRLKEGAGIVSIRVPYRPGEYELRLEKSEPGNHRILLSIPFRSIAPAVEIKAAESVPAGGNLEVRLIGEISPNSRLRIVPFGKPPRDLVVNQTLRGGLVEAATFAMPKTAGKYEIHYVSHTQNIVYARKALTIR